MTHCEITNATRYVTRAKKRPDTLVEMLAYRLADDEAHTLSRPLRDIEAAALTRPQKLATHWWMCSAGYHQFTHRLPQ